MQITHSPDDHGKPGGFLSRLAAFFRPASRQEIRPAPKLYTLEDIMDSCGFPPDDYKKNQSKQGVFSRIVHSIRDGGTTVTVEICSVGMNDIAVHLNREITTHENMGEDRVFTHAQKFHNAGLIFASIPDRPGFYSVGSYHISPGATSVLNIPRIHRANPRFSEKTAQKIMKDIKQLLETKFLPKTSAATVDGSVVVDPEPKRLTLDL